MEEGEREKMEEKEKIGRKEKSERKGKKMGEKEEKKEV